MARNSSSCFLSSSISSPSSPASIELSCFRRSELYYASSDSFNASRRADSPVSVAGFLSNSDSSSNGDKSLPWELDEVDPPRLDRSTVVATAVTPEKEEKGGQEEEEEEEEEEEKEIPMTHIFMEDEHRAFMHRGQMVYTRAPQQNQKSLLGHPARLKKSKQQNGEEVPGLTPNPRPFDSIVGRGRIGQAHNDDRDNEPGRSMKLNRTELLKLQSQVEELKTKVLDKEEMLQAIKQAAQTDIKLLEEAEMADLRSRVEGLQRELFRRDFLLQSLQHQLSEKRAEIGNTKLLIKGLQNELLKSNHKHSQMENDIDDLRFELAALKYEHQVAGASHLVAPQPDQAMDYEHLKDMEETRNKYLAAILAARDNPAEEVMAVAAEMRRRLHGFVKLAHVFPE